MHRFVGVLGVIFIIGVCYVFSTNRRAIRYKTVAWGLGLQIALAFLVMRWSVGQLVFSKLGAGAKWLLDFSYYGSSFVFGDLGQNNSPRGFYFAFQALPIIIFIAAFFALLYYFGVMQVIVNAMAPGDDRASWARAAPNRSTSPPASSWARPKRRSPFVRFSRK